MHEVKGLINTNMSEEQARTKGPVSNIEQTGRIPRGAGRVR